MGTKTYQVLMGLTYSNMAYGYKHTIKNNDTEQLENNTKLHNQNLEIYNNIKIK